MGAWLRGSVLVLWSALAACSLAHPPPLAEEPQGDLPPVGDTGLPGFDAGPGRDSPLTDTTPSSEVPRDVPLDRGTDTGARPDLPTDTGSRPDVSMDTGSRPDVPADTGFPVDVTSCGALGLPCCGERCATGLACESGRCVTPCPVGYARCGGACRDLATDPQHCGACGSGCASGPNATPFCRGGACRLECAVATADCDGDPTNGCETDLTTGLDCGRCGERCASGSRCVGGTCSAPCAEGQTLCGATCAETTTDPSNCGGCGRACAGGQSCQGGVCVACGAPGQACCAPALTCQPGSVCVTLHEPSARDYPLCLPATTTASGRVGQGCTSAGECERGATCISLTAGGSIVLRYCIACGDSGEACCGRDHCHEGLFCRRATALALCLP